MIVKKKVEWGKIYLANNGKNYTYIVYNSQGEQRGSLTNQQLDLKDDIANHLGDENLKKRILKITSKAGHTENINVVRALIAALLALPEFLYKSSYDPKEERIIIWIDPQEEINALFPLCRNDDRENLATLLSLCAQKYGSEKTEGFRKFIAQVSKDGFSPLNSACNAGHLKVVKKLLVVAEEAYGKGTKGFKEFIRRRNNKGFSPLNSACNAGHLAIVEELLKVAIKVYEGDENGLKEFIEQEDEYGFSPFHAACKAGYLAIVEKLLTVAEEAYGKGTEGFKEFIRHLNNAEFSPLNSACAAGHLAVVEKLLAVAEKAYGKGTEEFKEFITHPNKKGFTPLNSACIAGHFHVVEKLLKFAEEAYGKGTEGFKKFITHPNKEGFTPLHSACIAGHLAIVKKLLEVAEKAYGEDKAGFRAFLNQQNKAGFTPLNALCYEAKTKFKTSEQNQEYKTIAILLLQKRADPTIKQFSRKGGYNAIQNAPHNWKHIFSDSLSSTSSAKSSSSQSRDYKSESEVRESARDRRNSTDSSSTSSAKSSSSHSLDYKSEVRGGSYMVSSSTLFSNASGRGSSLSNISGKRSRDSRTSDNDFARDQFPDKRRRVTDESHSRNTQTEKSDVRGMLANDVRGMRVRTSHSR